MTGQMKRVPRPRDPYVAIIEAAKRNRGVRLTKDEVFALSFDDAIAERALVVSLDEPRANAPLPEEG